ncbi:unnamed protein product, partial [Brassica oleracea var. botrytis]
QGVKYFSRFIHLSVLKQRMLIIICDLRKRLSSYMTRKGGWIAQGEISELKKQTKISYERQLNRITYMV